jgi:hypothetical protein
MIEASNNSKEVDQARLNEQKKLIDRHIAKA